MRKLCRLLFSRYAISALIILLYLVAVTLLLAYSAAAYFWFAALGAIVDIFIILSLVNRDTNPEFKVSWLIIVTLVPVFGAVLYLIFYRGRAPMHEALQINAVSDTVSNFDNADSTHLSSNYAALNDLAGVSPEYAGHALSILRLDKLAKIYKGTQCKYYPSGASMFADMKAAILGAREYIFLEYFILCEGQMLSELTELLIARARDGIDVRLLYDDIGSMSGVPESFDKKMREAGISCFRFAKVTPRVSSVHNNRDHRKIFVVDGCVAFTGGVNIADEYIGKVERFGHWKDGGVRVTGDAALGFVRQFLSLYDFTSKTVSDYARLLNTRRTDATVNKSDGGYFIPFGSGPYPVYRESVGKRAIVDTINRARSYLYITTPYLVIDYELTEALRSAALRGVDVRIITPSVPDKPTVKLMTKSSYLSLIKAGVRIFEYSPGFMHEKLLLADGECAILGTINLDYRSLVHHYENALWIYASPVLRDMRRGFMASLSASREIDERAARLKPHERAVRYLVRIFAPLL